MDNLVHARYTMEDARRQREPFEYAQIITRSAKSCNMTLFSQLYVLYNGMDIELRRDLSKPDEDTDLDSFLQAMEDNKELWWGLGKRRLGIAHGIMQQNRNFRAPGSSNPNQQGVRFGNVGEGGGGYRTPVYSTLPPPRQTQYSTSYQFRNSNQYSAYQPQQQYRPLAGSYPQGRGQPLPAQGNRQQYPQQSNRPQYPPMQAGRGQQFANYPSRQSIAAQSLPPSQQPLRQNYNPQGTYNRASIDQYQRAYFGDEQENYDPSWDAYQGDYYDFEA